MLDGTLLVVFPWVERRVFRGQSEHWVDECYVTNLPFLTSQMTPLNYVLRADYSEKLS